ncbi:response regulator [Methylomonas montana]|uniref:HD domain-containing phosphohydrolase n=1 Tax=Methylomonas montana TaxID=3058963 RepID=UPI00265829FF|nr:HD domain-containing phosphohydrolase [Methylomonas montana]WKJ89418.1 response regulator [Methylomonas montana]
MTESASGISQKTLFVDDEVLLLEGVKRQLRRDFDIAVAEGGEAALARLACDGPFAVVVSDYNMPGMDGIAFLNEVHRRYPDTVLVMLTGRAELDLAVNALHNAHISRFLNKPCPKEVLLETLSDGLEQYRLRMSEQILQNQLQQANQQLNLLNSQLETLVAQKTRALQLQYRYVARITQMGNSQAILDALIDAVGELTGLRTISLWLSPQLDSQFSCRYPAQTDCKVFNASQCPDGIIKNILNDRQIWQAGQSGDTVLSEFELSLFAGTAFMSIPLPGKAGVLGLVNLAGDRAALENDELAALASMADVTATALQSHWHREAFEDAQDAIITALAKLSEYRDPETGAHLLRLKQYCALICRFLAETDKYRGVVTPAFTQDLVRSSPLHDIGKVGIPDAILKKPGRLTPDEFEVMKTHAQIGGDTLRTVFEQYPSQTFIKCGMDVAYGHHEKWNGSGYPNGLQGNSIPLAARILALVDVYDALTCRRVYKVPYSREQANSIISEGNGSHFDPDIVAAFLCGEAEFHRIAEQFADIV